MAAVRGAWFLAPALILILALELVLRRAGEFAATAEVAESVTLESEPTLALRMILSQETPTYRLTQIQQRRPRFLVLGSSRVQRFRREMFCRSPHYGSFYNSSGTITGVGDLEVFLGSFPTDYAPEILLVGLDSWWLNSQTTDGTGRSLEIDTLRDRGLTLDSRLYAYGRLLRSITNGDLELGQLRRVLLGRDEGVRRYGLLAWVSRGFSNDGSLKVLSSETPDRYVDRERPPVVERVHEGTFQFVSTGGIDRERLSRLAQALEELGERGTEIVGWLPPYSTEVVSSIENTPVQKAYYSSFLDEMKRLFESRGWLLLEATSPVLFGLDDRAMEDGFHAMETFHVAALAHLGDDQVVSESLGLSPTCLREVLASEKTTHWYTDLERACECSTP